MATDNETKCPKCGAAIDAWSASPLTYFKCGMPISPSGRLYPEGQTKDCRVAELTASLVAAEREVERLREFIDGLPEKIRKSGEPGSGGIDITGGIPSQVYVAIGRDRYDDEYDVARETADAVRDEIAGTIPYWRAALSPPAERGDEA
jgi:hypothetical protein